MKIALLFSLAWGLTFATALAEDSPSQNGYKGIEPGKSTLADAKNILGEPKEIEKAASGIDYRFDKVIVTISRADQSRVVSVTIDGDRTYESPSKLKLGDSDRQVEKAFPNYKGGNFNDRKNTILYWIEERRITKIILRGR